MPMLIFHCRTKTFPGHHSTADYTGWRSDFTVAGTANEFHTDFPPCISVYFAYNHLKFNVNK